VQGAQRRGLLAAETELPEARAAAGVHLLH
jgi:hypothetical protein